MNYESSPFQGYSSISVDDLKDQANSLLNLVTEEQRPLRVFMNNSKEFFLFPQDMMILSLNELGKAFLNVDKFVSQNQPYASTRPNAE